MNHVNQSFDSDIMFNVQIRLNFCFFFVLFGITKIVAIIGGAKNSLVSDELSEKPVVWIGNGSFFFNKLQNENIKFSSHEKMNYCFSTKLTLDMTQRSLQRPAFILH